MAINVKITRPIYIRIGAGRSFDSIGTAIPGRTIEMDGTENGEVWKGINTWYFKFNDAGKKQYYWAGGTTTITEDADSGNGLPAIITDYEIDQLWAQTKGAGIMVAVIDTGLNFTQVNIIGKTNISYFNVITGTSARADCLDAEGHGTHCAGVVCAQGPAVFGVAPAVDLLVIKATVNGSMACKDLAAAITKAVDLGAHVISVSYGVFKTDADIALLDAAAQYADGKQVIIVASSGDGGGALIFSDSYPASYDTAISVGSCDGTKNFATETTVSNHLGILAPGENISLIGLDNQQPVTDSGTSYSAPFVAGVCALFLAMGKTPANIPQLLKTTAINKTQIQQQIQLLYPGVSLNKLTDLGIINPVSLLN